MNCTNITQNILDIGLKDLTLIKQSEVQNVVTIDCKVVTRIHFRFERRQWAGFPSQMQVSSHAGAFLGDVNGKENRAADII